MGTGARASPPVRLCRRAEVGTGEMDHLWRIELLGWLRVSGREEEITRFRTQKTRSLLAYLALYLRRSHPREALVDLFWPERDFRLGRQNLRQALSSLRRRLEPPGTPMGSVLLAEGDAVRLNSEAVTTDVAEFESALRSAGSAENAGERRRWREQAVALYRGELLPGFFEEWALSERLRLAGDVEDLELEAHALDYDLVRRNAGGEARAGS